MPPDVTPKQYETDSRDAPVDMLGWHVKYTHYSRGPKRPQSSDYRRWKSACCPCRASTPGRACQRCARIGCSGDWTAGTRYSRRCTMRDKASSPRRWRLWLRARGWKWSLCAQRCSLGSDISKLHHPARLSSIQVQDGLMLSELCLVGVIVPPGCLSHCEEFISTSFLEHQGAKWCVMPLHT